MDLEFHYYITYLICIKAGFNHNHAQTISYSSQYVDDNIHPVIIKNQKNQKPYHSTLTQTYNLTLQKRYIHSIYISFHFLPTITKNIQSMRKDGKVHTMETRAGNFLSRTLLDYALKSNNLYLIGIATHSFVDTWAHQNFTGTFDEYNAMPDFKSIFIPNIGHADALFSPDEVSKIWRDDRLLNSQINNNERFLEAALNLFNIFYMFLHPMHNKSEKSAIWLSLQDDLESIWLHSPKHKVPASGMRNQRINLYTELALEYSGARLTQYNKLTWKKNAIIEYFNGNAIWKNSSSYKKSDWYLFQEAAKLQMRFIDFYIKNSLKQ